MAMLDDKAAMRDEIRQIQAARARIRESKAALKKQQAATPTPEQVFGTPFVRKGEDVMSSRGYSYARAAAYALGALEMEDCKQELMVGAGLEKAMRDWPGWQPCRAGRRGRRVMAPLDPAYLMGQNGGGALDSRQADTLRSMIYASVAGGDDPEQAAWLTRKSGGAYRPDTEKVGAPTQSYIQQNLGGALVPFPEMGPLIPLLRNANALMNAGAQVFPLPPSGRIAFPRQTSPTTTYHVGEGTKITQSNVGTDQLVLAAKKIGAYVITNNELIRYGGPIVEQMFRNDMVISLGLQLDYDLLQAEGSDNVSAGLIGYPGVTVFTPTTAASGNSLAQMAPQDVYTWIANIRANNGKFEGWILRPELLYAMVGKRASVLTTGDNLGLFVFDLVRDFSGGVQTYNLGGYRVTDTPNVPLNRVQGSTTNGTVVYGGQWTDYRIGIYGTIEFATADQGDNLFPQDQTAVRAILSADGGPQHPGVFGYCDKLNSTVVGN